MLLKACSYRGPDAKGNNSRRGHATIPATTGSIGNSRIPLPAPNHDAALDDPARSGAMGGAPRFGAAPRTIRSISNSLAGTPQSLAKYGPASRAAESHSGGRRFESARLHHIFQGLNDRSRLRISDDND